MPLKFTLTENGNPTCDLPPATLRPTRTSGTSPAPIDESVYSGSADSGSDSRSPTASTTTTSPPGSWGGTYLAEILIDGSPAGEAWFELR